MNRLARAIHKAVTGHPLLLVRIQTTAGSWDERCLRCIHDEQRRHIPPRAW